MVRAYIDRHATRSMRWRNKGFIPLGDRQLIGAEPMFLLVHTSDTILRLAEETTSVAPDYDALLCEFERPFADRGGPKAIVYISGAPDGAHHLVHASQAAGAVPLHRYVALFEVGDNDTANKFAVDLQELVDGWEKALRVDAAAVPDWSVLTYDWVSDAVECLVGLKLSGQSIQTENAADARYPLRPQTREAQLRLLDPTGEVAGIFTRDDVQAAIGALLEAIRRDPR